MAGILQPLLLDVPERHETARLELRATRAGDGVSVLEAIEESRVELERWMPWASATKSAEDTERHAREMQGKWHAREVLDFCFFRRADGALVGKGGLHTIDWRIPRMEIGYWIRTSCAGQGFATEATLGLVGIASALGVARIEINTDARNVASRRVAEKSGFALEGIKRNHRRDTAGELADSCMYARIA